MMAFSQYLLRLFLSPLGLVGLAALDSSMLFLLPIAVDAAVVILSGRHYDTFWAFPLLATGWFAHWGMCDFLDRMQDWRKQPRKLGVKAKAGTSTVQD
jgi:hypothetical protein